MNTGDLYRVHIKATGYEKKGVYVYPDEFEADMGRMKYAVGKLFQDDVVLILEPQPATSLPVCQVLTRNGSGWMKRIFLERVT